MTELIRPSVVVELLKRHGLSPTKGLGQNFLVDNNALMRIIGAASLMGNETVLEIGPGLGTMTVELAARARQVIAVEKDKKLIPVLQETLSGHPNVSLIIGDALDIDYATVMAPHSKPYKVVANLPYYITTPMMMYLLECPVNWELLVFLVQKEVGGRLVAKAGTQEYGALTLAVQFYAEAQVVASVSPRAFFPPPQVSSSVVLLRGRADPDSHHGIKSKGTFFLTVRAAFQQRRKTLLNALTGGAEALPRELARQAIANSGLSESARGETLDIQAFARLANEIYVLQASNAKEPL